jgi:hypothetical protein
MKNFDSVIENPTKSQRQFLEGLNEVGLFDVRHSFLYIFSSPQLKAQVSFSDRSLSGVRPSVCPSFCKLLHFRLLLQNHRANFKQTWHKSSFDRGDSTLFK